MSSTSHFDEAAARAMVVSYQSEAVVRQRAVVLDALAPQPGERALDIGCGPGFMTASLADAVGESGSVTGFDLSEPMIQLAEERLTGSDNVQLAIGDVLDIDAPDNSFDLAACMQVLLYVDDIDRALTEIHRVLRPGGRVAFIETDWETTLVAPGDPEVTRQIFRAWDASVASPALPRSLPGLLRQQGFEIALADAIPIVDTKCEPGGFSDGTLRRCSRMAVRDGFADGAAVDAWREGLDAAVAAGTYLFCVNRYLFVATRA